jgi:hypothetical protein
MKEQAEFYRASLRLGLVKISDVIAWCDSVIMAEASPDIGIIEASVSGSQGVYAVVDALSQVQGDFDKRAVNKRLFRSMYDLVNQDRNRLPKLRDGFTKWQWIMTCQMPAPNQTCGIFGTLLTLQ